MVAKTYSMGTYGLDAFPVEVETDLSSGLPGFEVVVPRPGAGGYEELRL